MSRRCHAQLILAHVLTSVTPEPANLEVENRPENHRLETQAREKLERLSTSECLEGVSREAMIRWGEVWNGLSQIIDDRHADLVVLGTRGLSGLRRLKLGSTAEDVTRAIPCAAMIVGPNVVPEAPERFRRILYTTNFNHGSLHALQRAVTLANEDHASLTMLHVLPLESSPTKRDQLTRKYTSKLWELLKNEGEGCPGTCVEVKFGKPGVEIVGLAETMEADLIVMGAHGAGRASTFLPSTLHHVLSHARCPVLTTCAG